VANATNNVLSSCSKARAGGFCDTDDSKAAGATCCAACNKVEELTYVLLPPLPPLLPLLPCCPS